MDKVLVVVFDSERKAYEGLRALQELSEEGSINLYSNGVIARDASGKVVPLQQGDVGLLYDLAQDGVGEDFVSEVEQSLRPGKVAVVAEIGEEWTLPVDTRMEALGGVVHRRAYGEIVDAQIERDVATLNAEIDEMEADLNRASGEARAKLQKQVDAAKAKRQAMRDDIHARTEELKREARSTA